MCKNQVNFSFKSVVSRANPAPRIQQFHIIFILERRVNI